MPSTSFRCAVALAGAVLLNGVAGAQVRTVDPNKAMQGDLAPVPESEAAYGTDGVQDRPGDSEPAEDAAGTPPPAPAARVAGSVPQESDRATTQEALAQAAADDPTRTYQRDDLLAAAEGVFGKGAEGLAKMLEKVLKDQGQPSAYIGGREVGGAFIAGLRYGSGTLHHKVEGDMPIYWTGPSVGFDFGGNGSKSFVLVYNVYDTADLFHRFPQAEGTAYLIGGFTASYLRKGDIVLIPIRLGVGWRLGANVGYMNFSRKPKVVPF